MGLDAPRGEAMSRPVGSLTSDDIADIKRQLLNKAVFEGGDEYENTIAYWGCRAIEQLERERDAANQGKER
jgi:hypothetical protein